jgi:hypothetical protein
MIQAVNTPVSEAVHHTDLATTENQTIVYQPPSWTSPITPALMSSLQLGVT